MARPSPSSTPTGARDETAARRSRSGHSPHRRGPLPDRHRNRRRSPCAGRHSRGLMTATRSRRADITSGIAALATLLLLLIGVPLLLGVLAGWPLPRALPSLSQIRDALDN